MNRDKYIEFQFFESTDTTGRYYFSSHYFRDVGTLNCATLQTGVYRVIDGELIRIASGIPFLMTNES